MKKNPIPDNGSQLHVETAVKKKNENRNTFTGFKSRLLCNKELDWKYSTRSERKTFKCRLKQLTEA